MLRKLYSYHVPDEVYIGAAEILTEENDTLNDYRQMSSTVATIERLETEHYSLLQHSERLFTWLYKLIGMFRSAV